MQSSFFRSPQPEGFADLVDAIHREGPGSDPDLCKFELIGLVVITVSGLKLAVSTRFCAASSVRRRPASVLSSMTVSVLSLVGL